MTPERFRSLLAITANGCWEFAAGRNEAGYGVLRVGARRLYAHRYAMTLTGAVLSTGDVVMHSCDNPPCCNPAHLSIGTMQQNTTDAKRKGRLVGPHKRSECKHGHPLTPENSYPITRRGLPNRKCLICKRAGDRAFYAKRRSSMTSHVTQASHP